MITIGIDLAAQPKNTAVCWIEWADGRAIVRRLVCQADDEALLGCFPEGQKVGIDVPFGWPDAFVDAVGPHRAGKGWPPGENLRKLVLRSTDQFVYERVGRRPLSVSADRIAVPAMRAAGLLSRAVAEGISADRTGKGALVEVYPAAALAVWGFARTSYKGTKRRSQLCELLFVIEERTKGWLELGASDRESCQRQDNALDALIAALVARAAALGFCEPIPVESQTSAESEGWIALPTRGSLEKLRCNAEPVQEEARADQRPVRWTWL